LLHVVNRKLRRVGKDWGSFFFEQRSRGKKGVRVKIGLYFEEVGLYFEESIGRVLSIGVVTGSDSGSCDAGYCQVG